MSDLIDRQAAIDAIRNIKAITGTSDDEILLIDKAQAQTELMMLSSAQSERDIPKKPNETIDTAWGIPLKQAVCPKCDCYLGHVAFLGDYKGKRITYCETCGQAIDWEGWEYDG